MVMEGRIRIIRVDHQDHHTRAIQCNIQGRPMVSTPGHRSSSQGPVTAARIGLRIPVINPVRPGHLVDRPVLWHQGRPRDSEGRPVMEGHRDHHKDPMLKDHPAHMDHRDHPGLRNKGRPGHRMVRLKGHRKAGFGDDAF